MAPAHGTPQISTATRRSTPRRQLLPFVGTREADEFAFRIYCSGLNDITVTSLLHQCPVLLLESEVYIGKEDDIRSHA